MGEEEEEDEQETRGDPWPASPSSAEKYILVSSRQLSVQLGMGGEWVIMLACGYVLASFPVLYHSYHRFRTASDDSCGGGLGTRLGMYWWSHSRPLMKTAHGLGMGQSE